MQASEALLLVVASLVFGLDTNLVHAEGAPDLSVCRLNRTLEMIERCLADSAVSGMRTSGDEMTKALAQGTTTACHGYRKPIAYALCRCTYALVS